MTAALPSRPIKLYRTPLSGHCHRVELMLAFLGLPYETVDLDMVGAEHKDAAHLARNPFGEVPAIEDGDVVMSDSAACLVYLVKTYAPGSHWLPEDAITAAEIQRWLSVAQGPVFHGPCMARLVTLFGMAFDHGEAVVRSKALFAVMDPLLAERRWLAKTPQISIADVAGYSYIAHAPEGAVSLAPFAHIRSWLDRVEAHAGFVPMAKSAVPEPV